MKRWTLETFIKKFIFTITSALNNNVINMMEVGDKIGSLECICCKKVIEKEDLTTRIIFADGNRKNFLPNNILFVCGECRIKNKRRPVAPIGLIRKTFSFSAAHALPSYNGKCKNLHGHTWKVEVEIKREIKEDGMIIDFSEIKKEVKSIIDKYFDHTYLNGLIANPTAENIAFWFWDYFMFQKPTLQFFGLQTIRIWESESSMVEVSWNDITNILEDKS